MTRKTQLTLDFEPGIAEQYKTLKRCVSTVVYSYRGGMEAIAAACDVAPSTLSRMLNEHDEDKRHLPIDFLTTIIAVTGDTRPIQWLAAKFLPDDEARKAHALNQLALILPTLTALANTAAGRTDNPPAPRRRPGR